MIRIRDPIHGTIRITSDELAVVDHPIFQRLRGIKQLGFTDQAFPGATHTRYAHSIGAMEVASKMFDAVFPMGSSPLGDSSRARLRQLLRLSLLLHDLGHPPGSHASERAMPAISSLNLPCYSHTEAQERASHEDYTIKLLIDSDLTDCLVDRFGDTGITPQHIAHLISGKFPDCAPFTQVDGIDYFPLLTQMVSGEMDADRMDYLQRDSFYTGVSYGKFDHSWLLENMLHNIVDDRAYMAITNRAVFAFEDFLLSRYHMFVSVYYHYISVGLETMLGRFYQEAPEDFAIPSDSAAYARTDDIALWSALRTSSNPWAQRIASRDAYRRVLETSTTDGVDLMNICNALDAEKLDYFTSRDKGVLSKYYLSAKDGNTMYVVNRQLDVVKPLASETEIYERYKKPTQLQRIYVKPEQQHRARQIIKALLAS
ncbi:MAG: HD domain-containing protein [Bradymonadia bacterium]